MAVGTNEHLSHRRRDADINSIVGRWKAKVMDVTGRHGRH
jgi:hypothetical protein